MLRLRACGAALPGLPGPGTPLRTRLALAAALSVALHAALVFGVHPDSAASRKGYAPMITARLSPLPAAPDAETASVVAQPLASAVEIAPAAPAEITPPAAPAIPYQDTPAAAAGLGPIEPPAPAPRYYLAAELDRRPEPLQAIEPEIPEDAGGAEGSVVLQLRIDERGSVDEVVVIRAQPQGLFEASALAAFSRARFSPGMLRGVAVKSQLLVEVQFRNRQPIASGRGY